MDSRGRRGDACQEPPEVPWHNRTATLLGASVAALAAIAVVIASASWISGQFSEPEQAPINFVDPSFSASTTRSSRSSLTPTTTATITSTSPPATTDINPESTSPTSPDTSSPPLSTRPPTTRRDDDATTTRKRPRTNVTRTVYPMP